MDQSLTSLRRIPILPRKYEDTKPVVKQAFSHNSVLELGQKILRESDQENENRHRNDLQKCEENVWKKAEVYKDDCILQALKKVKNKEDKKVKLLQQESQKQLRKEISRVEGILQHEILEKVHEERTSGERKLNETVVSMHEDFAIELQAAITETREEQEKIAQQTKEKLQREHDEELATQHNENENSTLLQLKGLENLILQETNKEIEATVKAQTKMADNRSSAVAKTYNAIIDDLKEQIKKQEENQKEIDAALNDMKALKNKYKNKLETTQQSFIEFVESCQPELVADQTSKLISLSSVECNERISNTSI